MDVYLWVVVSSHHTCAILPELPTLVVFWSGHDFIYCLVYDHWGSRSRPGDLSSPELKNQSLYLIILYDELGVISVSWLVVDFHYIVDSKSIWEGILIHWNPVSITCSTNPRIRFASFIKMMTVQGFHVSCHPTCWNMRMWFMGVRCKSAKRTTFTVQFHV